ncbi:MAG: hypothetical protein J6J16_06575 [Lachnospiraceae bacterium]|nr:hypothetical protein [Lachnospiraceae bacterium]
MGRVKYYFSRLMRMNYGAMFKAVGEVHKRSGKNRVIIFFDMIGCSIKYQAGYMDYKVFFFENLTKKQRASFVTRGVNNAYIKKLNDPTYNHFFRNKKEFNEKFREYLNRDFIDLDVASYEEFLDFIEANPTFMAKPKDGQCGKDIEKITIDNNTVKTELYNKLKENKQLLLETYVVQHPEISRLFPKSVNTIRMVTMRVNGKTTIAYRVIRIGNGDNVVDNFNHGGMFSVVDENGKITKPAIDKAGNVYETHPVTGTEIMGFQIPRFEEAKALVMKMSEVIPEIGYTGWDICITEKGPVVIEGNEFPGYDVYQSKIHLDEDNMGLKPMFDKIIKGA